MGHKLDCVDCVTAFLDIVHHHVPSITCIRNRKNIRNALYMLRDVYDGNIDPTLLYINSLHRLLNCELGRLDYTVGTR